MRPASSLAVAFLLFLFAPIPANAQSTVDRQQVDITIAADGSANGTWTASLNLRDLYGVPIFPVPREFGNTGGTKYSLISILDEQKNPANVYLVDDQDYGYQAAAGETGVRKFYVNESITPMFDGPIAVYEFWSIDNAKAPLPVTTIRYPSSWSLLENWPTASTTAPGLLAFNSPVEYRPLRPIIALFKTGHAGDIEQIGRYTVAGSYADVAKIKDALALMDGIPALMQATIGITPPDTVYIIADDLTKVDSVGYEAEALAANPNVIIFNDRLTADKSPQEIAEILAHELTHLAMFKLGLYQGNPYPIRWLDEGVAVYFGSVAHKQLLSGNDRIIDEELSRTHAASPSEAAALYDDPFDFAFDGSRKLGTGASYDHAGLVFARLGDVSGGKGFTALFDGLKGAKLTYNPDADNMLIIDTMQHITSLTKDQLLYPGKTEADITGIVGRISHPDNISDADATIVANHIKGLHQYFSATGTTNPDAAANTRTESAPPAPAATSSAPADSFLRPLSSNLRIGSQGGDVLLLKVFLIIKGFLTISDVKDLSFDAPVQQGVTAYQKSVGLPQVGVVGSLTRASINKQLFGK